MRDRTTRRTTAAFATWRTESPRRRLALDPFDHVDDLEQQAAGGGIGLDQLDLQPVAQAEGLAGALADQDLPAFVVAEEFLAERADRDQPVGAGAVEGGEQAEAGDAGDPCRGRWRRHGPP